MDSTGMLAYMVPLFLGMTYNVKTNRPGIDIFHRNNVIKPTVESAPRFESHYKVVTDHNELLDSLQVTGDLDLKIKSGMIDIKGKGSFLKNQGNVKNSVMIVSTLKYYGKSESLPSHEPIPGWEQRFSTDVLGTHYVSRIDYGIEMIACVKFTAHNESDLESIKADATLKIVKDTKDDDANKFVVSGNLDKLKENLEDKASIEITFYGTMPVIDIPNTIDGVKELIRDFPKLITESGLSDGVPMEVHLTPLTDIAKDYDRFVFDETSDDPIQTLSGPIDDLINARNDLKEYARSLPYDLDEKYKKQIGDLLKKTTDILRVLYNAIWTYDPAAGPEQLDEALKAYDEEDTMSVDLYTEKFLDLKKAIDPHVNRESNVATDTFIHWGKNECPDTEEMKEVRLYGGFVFTSNEDGSGGAANYECIRKGGDDSYDLQKAYAQSFLAAVRFADMDEKSSPFKGEIKDVSRKGVPCAKCYLPDASAVSMFPAAKSCPLSWITLYHGYLMSSPSVKGQTTEYICVDEEPSGFPDIGSSTSSRNNLAFTVLENSLLPEEFKQGALVKCVVCAMGNNQAF